MSLKADKTLSLKGRVYRRRVGAFFVHEINHDGHSFCAYLGYLGQFGQYDTNLNYPNRTTHIRHQCRKTTVLSFYRCLINSGVEKVNYI